MNNKEISALKGYAICLFMAVLIIALGLMGVKLYDTQKRLAELEKGTSDKISEQQAQIDGINTDIQGINANIDGINTDIDAISQYRHLRGA